MDRGWLEFRCQVVHNPAEGTLHIPSRDGLHAVGRARAGSWARRASARWPWSSAVWSYMVLLWGVVLTIYHTQKGVDKVLDGKEKAMDGGE
jgi:hypothetical protein